MSRLVALLGNPQGDYPVVHVTGTNGKGSTVAMLSALLGAKGLRVGTYTSPDLERLNERMAIAGEPIGDVALAEVLASIADAVGATPTGPGAQDLSASNFWEGPPAGAGPPSASRFEILTAAALSWFADEAVDVAVVEVGLGGLHDATNVVDAQVAVVTNVALDHAEVIGPTLADIATEKAGIVKPGSTLILGESDPALAAVFRSAAEATGVTGIIERGRDFACESSRIAVGGRVLDLRTPAERYPEVFLPLHGAHQGDNAACALAAAEAFFGAPLHPDVVGQALGSVVVPGRMEVVGRRPLYILDGAHNPAGASAAGAALTEEFATAERWVVVMGVLSGRDPAEMLSALGPARICHLIACAPPSPRALDPSEVAAAARGLGIASEVAATPGAALDRARGLVGPDDLILVTGSLYLVGQARSALVGLLPSTA